MRIYVTLVFLSLLCLPLLSRAETLERSAAKPNPAPLALSKKIMISKQLYGPYCEEVRCTEQEVTKYRKECRDDYSWKEVCKDEMVCVPGDDGNAKCTYERVCKSEYVNEPRCWEEPYKETERWCLPEKFNCYKNVDVLDHVWKATLKVTFDPRAILKKGTSERFKVTLDGDERAPKLIIKKEKASFVYTNELSFSPDGKEVNLEFRLKN